MAASSGGLILRSPPSTKPRATAKNCQRAGQQQRESFGSNGREPEIRVDGFLNHDPGSCRAEEKEHPTKRNNCRVNGSRDFHKSPNAKGNPHGAQGR